MTPLDPMQAAFAPYSNTPPRWLADYLLAHPAALEDDYATQSVTVDEHLAERLAEPAAYVEEALSPQAVRATRSRRRANKRRRERYHEKTAAQKKPKQLGRVEEPVPGFRLVTGSGKPAWRCVLPSGRTTVFLEPPVRAWPGPDDPDPTYHREERRLRDLADVLEAGPIGGQQLTTDDLDEIAREVERLRQWADAIRRRREEGEAACPTRSTS